MKATIDKGFKGTVMLIIFIENIVTSLVKGANYFVLLQIAKAVVFNTVFLGVSYVAISYSPYWVPSNWNPFLLFYFPSISQFINNLKI